MRLSKISISVAAAVLWSLLPAVVLAAEVKVIAHPSLPVSTLSAEELKGIFLETRTSLPDGTHVEPVLLRSGDVHHTFVARFIGRTDAALETYYRSMAFTGRGLIPKTLGSDDEVVRYVSKTKGAVGYVSAASAAPGVKTVAIK